MRNARYRAPGAVFIKPSRARTRLVSGRASLMCGGGKEVCPFEAAWAEDLGFVDARPAGANRARMPGLRRRRTTAEFEPPCRARACSHDGCQCERTNRCAGQGGRRRPDWTSGPGGQHRHARRDVHSLRVAGMNASRRQGTGIRRVNRPSLHPRAAAVTSVDSACPNSPRQDLRRTGMADPTIADVPRSSTGATRPAQIDLPRRRRAAARSSLFTCGAQEACIGTTRMRDGGRS